MRKLIFIPFLFICLILPANTYYVATAGGGGNDGNPGTEGSPWLTWAYGFSNISAGDSLIIRGGVYYTTSQINMSSNGTVTDTIFIVAYPGETPIMDFTNKVSTDLYRYGLNVTGDYLYFKGLVLRNMLSDYVNGYEARMFNFTRADYVTVENCICYNSNGVGFRQNRSLSFNYINCDAYTCCDTTPRLGGNTGERGSGFTHENADIRTAETYYQNCRAWNCSDQGFSGFEVGYVEWDGCWSFANGGLDAGGHGFKIGWAFDETPIDLQKTVKNCIAAFNRSSGITTNDANHKAPRCNVFNNTVYHNGYYSGWTPYVWGIYLYNPPEGTTGPPVTTAGEEQLKRVFKNNISDGNQIGNIYVASGAVYTHSENNWDIPLTLTTADYLSVDSTGITAARQADGSFPDNDCYNKFLHPSVTSQIIDAGTDLGNGDDIGAFQYTEQTDPEPPLVLSELSTFKPYWQTETTAISGGNVYDAGGGTISARGVCWNTAGSPTTADDKTTDGTGMGIFYSQMTGLSREVVYYVRAYATNEIGTAYGNQMTFRTSQILVIDGTPLVVDGKLLVTP